MLRLGTISRRAPALALAATLLVSTLGPSASPGIAAEPDQPSARLQIIVKSVKVHDDRDPGDGEMSFSASLADGDGEITRFTPKLATMSDEFDLGSGETRIMMHMLPSDGDTMAEGVSPEAGMPVYAGRSYTFTAEMTESDAITANEILGDVNLAINAANGWGIQEHTLRSVRDGKQGDFSVTFEIRRAPLPDLRPVNIKVEDVQGSTKKHVCMAVQNVENGQVGQFTVTLLVDGKSPAGGTAVGNALAPGMAEQYCVDVDAPTSGPHELSAVVDLSGTVTEYNEANNKYTQQVTISPPPSDLTVSAIRMNGRDVRGKDDCKPGNNDVVVVVKNGGTTAAGAFAVRLTVDGVEAADVAVPGLDAGKEHEVRMDDLRLKKGKRALLATVDSKGAISESSENNNERPVTAECKDDD